MAGKRLNRRRTAEHPRGSLLRLRKLRREELHCGLVQVLRLRVERLGRTRPKVEMNNQQGQTRFPGAGETISGNRPTITSGRGTSVAQRPGRLQLMVNFAVSCAFWVLVFNMMSLLRSGGDSVAAAPSGGTTSLALAMMTAPVGSLGPVGSSRQSYKYYDSVFYSAVQFGSNAQSAIEVGCASDPFIGHLCRYISRSTWGIRLSVRRHSAHLSFLPFIVLPKSMDRRQDMCCSILRRVRRTNR